MDEVVRRAEHFSNEHPSILRYTIDGKSYGLSTPQIQKALDTYRMKRTRETNYKFKGGVAGVVMGVSSLLIYYIGETLGKWSLQDPMYSILLSILAISSLGAPIVGKLADDFHDRKVEKLIKLLGKIYIKE